MTQPSLKEHAIWLSELFESLVEAGFSEFDAREMVAQRLPWFPGTEEEDPPEPE